MNSECQLKCEYASLKGLNPLCHIPIICIFLYLQSALYYKMGKVVRNCVFLNLGIINYVMKYIWVLDLSDFTCIMFFEIMLKYVSMFNRRNINYINICDLRYLIEGIFNLKLKCTSLRLWLLLIRIVVCAVVFKGQIVITIMATCHWSIWWYDLLQWPFLEMTNFIFTFWHVKTWTTHVKTWTISKCRKI